MNILMLSTEIEPNIKGGLGIHVTNLYKNFKKKPEINIDLVTVPSKNDFKDADILCSQSLFEFEEFTDIDIILDNFNQLAAVDYKKKYDLIHVQDFSSGHAGLVLSQVFNVPLIVTFHDTVLGRSIAGDYDLDSTNTELHLLQKRICEVASKVICVSTSLAEEVRSLLNCPAEKIDVIHNGIDSNYKRNFGKKEKDKKQVLKILFVGRFLNYKGIIDLIDLAKILKQKKIDFLITMVGDKTNNIYSKQFYENLEKSESKDRFNIIPFLSHEELNKYYDSTDICIIPSHYEPFGITVLEGMSSGAITIASEVGGITDIIKNNVDGMLFKKNSPEDIARCVLKICNMTEEEKNVISTNAKMKCLEDFSWEKIGNKTIELYKKEVGNFNT